MNNAVVVGDLGGRLRAGDSRSAAAGVRRSFTATSFTHAVARAVWAL
jgi:hypothetical protein